MLWRLFSSYLARQLDNQFFIKKWNHKIVPLLEIPEQQTFHIWYVITKLIIIIVYNMQSVYKMDAICFC